MELLRELLLFDDDVGDEVVDATVERQVVPVGFKIQIQILEITYFAYIHRSPFRDDFQTLAVVFCQVDTCA